MILVFIKKYLVNIFLSRVSSILLWPESGVASIFARRFLLHVQQTKLERGTKIWDCSLSLSLSAFCIVFWPPVVIFAFSLPSWLLEYYDASYCNYLLAVPSYQGRCVWCDFHVPLVDALETYSKAACLKVYWFNF